MAIGCRGRIRTGVIEVIEPRELPLLHSAVCPLRGIPSMQYARPKAYPSSRTVVGTAGLEPATVQQRGLLWTYILSSRIAQITRWARVWILSIHF